MPRYIDADKLNKKKKYLFQTQGMPFPKSEYFIKADDLFAAPTADVVEVVRCKDCKYCEHCYPVKAIGEEAEEGWYCKIQKRRMEHDDFCSYSERKEGE